VFEAPGELAGQEAEIIAGIVTELESTFAGTGIIFTTVEPTADTEYSTIYIGGTNAPFWNFGVFGGLAEKVDVGNRDADDAAFVFSNDLLAFSVSSAPDRLTESMLHEAGHLLGYAHEDSGPPDAPILSHVAEGTAEIAWNGAPTQVGIGETANFPVKIRLTGVSASGPYTLTRLGLYEYDGALYSTIKEFDDQYSIPSQNTWHTHTFTNVRLSDYESDGVGEVYGFVRISDNNGWSTDPSDYTPELQVTIGSPALSVSTSSLSFGSSSTTKTFTVRNSGSGTLSYAISDNKPWLSVSPTSGSSTGESDTISVTVNRSALPSGVNHTGRVTIDPSHGSNRYVDVSVTEPAPTISKVTPTSSSVTVNIGESPRFRVSTADGGSDLDRIEWRLTGAATYSDTDQVSGSSDSAEDFNDYVGNYTFDKAGNYTLTATVYDDSGDTDSVSGRLR